MELGSTKVLKNMAVAAIVTFLLSSCAKPQEQATGPPPAVPVVIAPVVQQDTPVVLSAFGHVAPYATVSVKSRVTGELEKTYFHSGDTVQAGQLLFTIDKAPFILSLKEAAANLARAKTEAGQAERDRERYQKMLEAATVSPEVAEQKISAALKAQNDVLAYEAQLATASQNLAYCDICAATHGLTGKRLIDDGNIITENQDTLTIINQVRPIRAKFSVPEKHLPDILKYYAQAPLQVKAMPPGQEGNPEWGTLTFVNNEINHQTGMIDLEAKFPNEKLRLWPGQYVTAELILTTEPGALRVPAQAVQRGDQGSYVFVVKPDQTVEIRPVTPGRRAGDELTISQGVKAGEQVVLEGQLKLFPGAKVESKPAEKPAAAEAVISPGTKE